MLFLSLKFELSELDKKKFISTPRKLKKLYPQKKALARFKRLQKNLL